MHVSHRVNIKMLGKDKRMEEILERMEAKLDMIETRLSYPGESCSKPQDGGCFQNMFSARECPQDQHCTTVNQEKKIFRCKTPSIGYTFTCFAKVIVVIIIFIAILGILGVVINKVTQS